MKNLAALFAMSVLILAACGKNHTGEGTPQPVAQPTYQWLSANVIGPKCLPCHNETTPVKDHKTGAEIRLGTFAHLMNYITPGDPSKSELYKDVKTGDMPRPKGNPLSADLVQAFQDWIQNGAKETL